MKRFQYGSAARTSIQIIEPTLTHGPAEKGKVAKRVAIAVRPVAEPLELRQLLSGFLNGRFTSVPLSMGYSLTQQGTADWAHWNSMSANGSSSNKVHKSTGSNQIADLTPVGPNGNYGSYQDTADIHLTWNDGTANPTPDNEFIKVWQNSDPTDTQHGHGPAGWSFTVPADTGGRTLYVLAGGYSATTSVTAQISDGSAGPFSHSDAGVANGLDRVLYTIDYAAATNGRTMTVTLLKTGNLDVSNSGSIDLVAAWLVTDIPASPSDLHAMTVAPTQVDLTWDDNSNNEDGFKIDYSTDNFSTFQTVVAGTDTDSKWITGLSPNTPYQFRVRATNSYGESVNATFVTAQTAAQVNPGDSNYVVVDNSGLDGFTDAAIARAMNSSPAGATIYIPPGTYTISSPIALLGGGRVYAGATALTTDTNGATTANDLAGTVLNSPSNQPTFSFDGIGDPAAAGMHNIRVTGLTFTGWGLDLQNYVPPSPSDPNSHNYAVNAIVVDNCHFNVTHDQGISNSTGIRNTVVANNLFDVPSGLAIYFYGASSDTGIGWGHLTVANNQIQAGHNTGIHIQSPGPNSTHLLVEQNYATQVGGEAFELQGIGTNTTIQDNYYYYDDP